MSMGRFTQECDLELHGVEIPAVWQFRIPTCGLEAELHPGAPLKISVRIEGAEESVAKRTAAEFVQTLYCRLLLQFGPNIEASRRPRCLRESFIPAKTSSSSLSVKRGSVTADSALVGRPKLTVTVAPADMEALARQVEARLVTPAPVTSAQLCTAIAMYTVGLETENRVVRFLVFYSALALAALFKWHAGGQSKVDELLLSENSKLPLSRSPKEPNKTETLYTKLRNELIHAGERGCDPTEAIAAVEAHSQEFQSDVSRIFVKL